MTRVPLRELTLYARNVLAVLNLRAHKDAATVVALRGELGAGKTTFTQALAAELGIREPIASPTYVLMKAYPIHLPPPALSGAGRFTKLVHIDAYRLERPDEFSALYPEQFLRDPHALVVVEWPEKLGAALPPPDLALEFSNQVLPEDERDIEMVE
jgi:tRNA threonylcarbamoyladenosine biosynthesis protein TsaE